MIRTATMEIVNRTGCGRLVIDDHVVTSARRVLTEHRDSTTFERRNRTVRMEFATTDHEHGINDASSSLAVAARKLLAARGIAAAVVSIPRRWAPPPVSTTSLST